MDNVVVREICTLGNMVASAQSAFLRPLIGALYCFSAISLFSSHALAQIQFEEVTPTAGMAHSGPSYGAAWGDLDHDGWPDLWVSNHGDATTLYRNNRDGTFENASILIDETDGGPDTHAAVWADFDSDGDRDILELVGAFGGNGQAPNRFFVNDGETFLERAEQQGIDYPLGRGRTPLWFDWDFDGDLDVLLANAVREEAPTALMTQDQGMFFVENELLGAQTQTNDYAQLLQFGNDFRPMLIVHGSAYPARVLDYSNSPFIDLSPTLGIPDNLSGTRDSAVADLTGDGLVDIFAVRAQDVSRHDHLDTNVIGIHVIANGDEKGLDFRAEGDVSFQVEPAFEIAPADINIGSDGVHPGGHTFVLSPQDPEVVGTFPHTPGVDFGLFLSFDPGTGVWSLRLSGDAWIRLNIVISAQGIDDVASVGFDNSNGEVPGAMLVQNGTGFDEIADQSGLDLATACESVAAADFDNDMDLDLYLVCRGWVVNQPNLLYENLGAGSFQLVSSAGGAEGSTEGLGDTLAVADYDRDGFVDLFVANGFGPPPFNTGPHQLFRNLGNENNWIEIDLEGVVSNRDGIGARVVATAGGVSQVREQGGGVHRYSQDHQRLHFGLAGNEVIDELEITWPNGITQQVEAIPADHIIQIIEPSEPQLFGAPSYQPGQDAGVFLWKDYYDGPYQLRVSGDGPNSQFLIDVLADATVETVTPDGLENNDALEWSENQIEFTSAVSTWEDGIEFSLPAGAKGMIAVTRDGDPNPRQLHVGPAGDPLPPAGWIVDANALPAIPAFQGGQDLGLFLGMEAGDLQARLSSSGLRHVSQTRFFFSGAAPEASPVDFEAEDTLDADDYTVSIETNVSTWWDGVDFAGLSVDKIGFTYVQDGLPQPNSVNPKSLDYGLPNAYELPVPSPLHDPEFDPAEDKGLYLWKDENEVWHLRVTAGGGTQQIYGGTVTASLPANSVTPIRLEANDILDTSDPTQIGFNLHAINQWLDGFDFEFPQGAELELQLNGNDQDAVALVNVGGERWPILRLPIAFSR